jgi:hypothetical protein
MIGNRQQNSSDSNESQLKSDAKFNLDLENERKAEQKLEREYEKELKAVEKQDRKQFKEAEKKAASFGTSNKANNNSDFKKQSHDIENLTSIQEYKKLRKTEDDRIKQNIRDNKNKASSQSNLAEQFAEIDSMLANLQTQITSLNNGINSFNTQYELTYGENKRREEQLRAEVERQDREEKERQVQQAANRLKEIEDLDNYNYNLEMSRSHAQRQLNSSLDSKAVEDFSKSLYTQNEHQQAISNNIQFDKDNLAIQNEINKQNYIDEQSKITEQQIQNINDAVHSNIVDQHNRVLNEQQSKILNEQARLEEQHLQTMNEQARINEQQSKILNEQDRLDKQHIQNIGVEQSRLAEQQYINGQHQQKETENNLANAQNTVATQHYLDELASGEKQRRNLEIINAGIERDLAKAQVTMAEENAVVTEAKVYQDSLLKAAEKDDMYAASEALHDMTLQNEAINLQNRINEHNDRIASDTAKSQAEVEQSLISADVSRNQQLREIEIQRLKEAETQQIKNFENQQLKNFESQCTKEAEAAIAVDEHIAQMNAATKSITDYVKNLNMSLEQSATQEAAEMERQENMRANMGTAFCQYENERIKSAIDNEVEQAAMMRAHESRVESEKALAELHDAVNKANASMNSLSDMHQEQMNKQAQLKDAYDKQVQHNEQMLRQHVSDMHDLQQMQKYSEFERNRQEQEYNEFAVNQYSYEQSYKNQMDNEFLQGVSKMNQADEYYRQQSLDFEHSKYMEQLNDSINNQRQMQYEMEQQAQYEQQRQAQLEMQQMQYEQQVQAQAAAMESYYNEYYNNNNNNNNYGNW